MACDTRYISKEGREKGAKINWNINRSQVEIQVKMLIHS